MNSSLHELLSRLLEGIQSSYLYIELLFLPSIRSQDDPMLLSNVESGLSLIGFHCACVFPHMLLLYWLRVWDHCHAKKK